MSIPKTIADYLRMFGTELADRTVKMHPALYNPGDPVSPRMNTLLRRPYPAQEVAAMSVLKRWEQARAAAVIAECGTGKTLVALAAIHCHSDGRPYTALALVPGHLTAKMAREAFQTLPGIRVFFIDALRDHARDGSPCGVNEVKLRHGKIVREGLHSTLTDLRLRKKYQTAIERWHREMCAGPRRRPVEAAPNKTNANPTADTEASRCRGHKSRPPNAGTVRTTDTRHTELRKRAEVRYAAPQ